jgi:hypothetical protein
MFVCVLCAFILCLPRVEAGETTGFPFCRLLRLAGITVEIFLPASTRGRHRISETVTADLREG